MNNNICYFDNAATTFMFPEVESQMYNWLSCANPDSHHFLGEKAKDKVEKCRLKIATYLGVDADEIFFCSGATEANNWVLNSFASEEILSSKIEHHSVLNNPHIKTKIGATPYGKIDVDSYDYWKRPTLVSLMMVNNVTGVVNDMETVSERMNDYAYLHCDCTQALGKIDLNLRENRIDFASMSGHKIHGPKGIGILYASHRGQRKLGNLMHGGQQEMGLRPGTLNVAGIVGMTNAIEIAYENMDEYYGYLIHIKNYFVGKLEGSNLDFEFLVDPDEQMPTHLNVAFPGIRAEQLLSQLSKHEICASSGSACDSDSGERNYVLKEMGITDELIDSSIRFSFSTTNGIADVDYCMEVLETILPLMK